MKSFVASPAKPLGRYVPNPKLRFLDQCREVLRVKRPAAEAVGWSGHGPGQPGGIGQRRGAFLTEIGANLTNIRAKFTNIRAKFTNIGAMFNNIGAILLKIGAMLEAFFTG